MSIGWNPELQIASPGALGMDRMAWKGLVAAVLSIFMGVISVGPMWPDDAALPIGFIAAGLATLVMVRWHLNRYHPDPAAARHGALTLPGGALDLTLEGGGFRTVPIREVTVWTRPGRWQLPRRARARRELVIAAPTLTRAFPAWLLDAETGEIEDELRRRGAKSPRADEAAS